MTSALVAVAAIALAGTVAGAVRILPWVLDPAVPWRVAAPFARGLATLVLEAAILVGWPLGWALASFRSVERGEARVRLTLGEAPWVTVARLAPQGALLAVALGAVAFVAGRDARAPGRVANELVSRSRVACMQSTAPSTCTIPFTSMTWLCAPGRAPSLVVSGRAIGAAPAGMVLTARGAHIDGDFRAIVLDDAHVRVSSHPPLSMHVATLRVHGMAAWARAGRAARASALSAGAHALLLIVTGWAVASLSAYSVLRRAARTRLGAIFLGVVGPLVALGLLRFFERAGAPPLAFAFLPVLAPAAVVVCARLNASARLSRLRQPRGAAST